MVKPSSRIALIHATAVAIAPIEEAFDQQWPNANWINILDDSLERDRGECSSLPPDVAERIIQLARYAEQAGAAAVLFTCSAFGPAIEMAAAQLAIPVLRPNEAMFEESLTFGLRLGLIASFAPAVSTMEEEFRAQTASRGLTRHLEIVIADGALDALRAGDVARHDQLLLNSARQLDHCDAIMLAQFSMARAKDKLAQHMHMPILTSPASAVKRVRFLLDRTGKAPA